MSKKEKFTIEELRPAMVVYSPIQIHYDKPSFWDDFKKFLRGLATKVRNNK